MTAADAAPDADAAEAADAGGEDRLGYRLLSGPDDHDFCERVSRALDQGYVLYGSPSISHGPDGPLVCQAVVLPAAPGSDPC